ncbi:uncharacterized protein LOC132560234 [Ylistrum balloti]|uniref:uncharacterized protein LOC132560234 n=1 Tax=Ylistrum balloti TaxID=509963 RepID=UPI002905A81F|nr:uncharacterized protein LOC132560234 [Ylistrum balloti]
MQSAVFLILCLMALLGQTLSRRHVYVYDGYGTDELHMLRMAEHLENLLDASYIIQRIGADEIIQGDWADNAALFVMPGGFDLGFMHALGDEGAGKIRKYVREGGAYLGQGAGSYYACDRIEFDLDGLDEVVGDRPLKFYPGMCSGPLFGPYNYHNYNSVRAADINFRFVSATTGVEEGRINLQAHYNGGNTFNSPMAIQNTTCVPLAFFTERDNDPAIVKCNTYSGRAVLTGVHLEFSSMNLNTNDRYLPLIQVQVYLSILRHLGLNTRPMSVLLNMEHD